jgi:hypothetical protein
MEHSHNNLMKLGGTLGNITERPDLIIQITSEITSEQRIKLNKKSYCEIQF